MDLANRIYRGGQPRGDDWQRLRDLGIEQVIKLNPERLTVDEERVEMGEGELFYCPITTVEQTLTEPDLEFVGAAAAFIRPGTFIHCEHGQDRTGLVVALYRISTGWTKESARLEMMANGFHPVLFGLDKAWSDLTA